MSSRQFFSTLAVAYLKLLANKDGVQNKIFDPQTHDELNPLTSHNNQPVYYVPHHSLKAFMEVATRESQLKTTQQKR